MKMGKRNISTIKSSGFYNLIVSLCLLLGCTNGEKHSIGTSDRNAKILTYWSAPNPQEFELAKIIVGEWNSTHEDIKVKLRALPAGQSSEEVLLSAMVARTTPDVCSNIWPGIINDFIRANGVVRLDLFDDFYEVISERVPEDMIKSVTNSDGGIYQIPWKTNPVMVQYNVKMFKEAGVNSFPKTYSEFIEAAKKITKDVDGDGKTDQWMGYRDIRPIWWQRYYDFYTEYITASGGQTLFKDGKMAIDRKAAVQVLDFFKQLYDNGYFPRSTLQGNAFMFGRIATEFTGPWNIAFLEKNAPETLDYDYAPLPVPDDYSGPIFTYGDHKNIVVFSNTKYPEESWEFVKFLINKEADYKLLTLANQIPVRKNLLSDTTYSVYLSKHPKLARFARQAAYTRGVDGVRDFKEILDAVTRYYEKSSIYGVMSPQKATDEMIEAINVIREWNK